MSFKVNDSIPSADSVVRQDPEAIRAAFEEYYTHESRLLCSSDVSSFVYDPPIKYIL
jgi:hypothetical protein